MRVYAIATIAALSALVIPSAALAGPTKGSKIRFAATGTAVAENAVTAQIAVTRAARTGKSKSATNTLVSVAYATSNGTAIAGRDYTSTNGRLTFPACGSTPAANDPCLRQLINVPVIDNAVIDGNRTVKLALTSPSANAVVVNPQKTTLTIADNEGPTRVSFDLPSYTTWEFGPQVEIHVFRSGAGISGTSTVDFSTANGTATSPGDYTAKATTLTFGPGEVDKTVLVDITDDSVVEPTESFSVKLANASTGMAIDTPSETATISDDDTPTPAHLAIDTSDPSVFNPTEGGDVTITVLRTGNLSATTTVDYATIAQSAAPDLDFAADSGTISFDPGDGSESFTVSTLDDSIHEGDETFSVALSNGLPAGTVLDVPNQTITIADNDPVPTITPGSTTTSGGTVTFIVQLSNPTTTDITVTYVIVDSSGNQVGTGTATVPAGSSSASVDVPVTGSGPYTVTLSNPTGGSIDTAHASSTSEQPQQQPTVSVDPSTGGTGSTGTGSTSTTGSTVSFDVTISSPTDHPVTVDYEIKDGSGATIGTGTATIPAGSTGTTVTAPVPAGTQGPVTVVIQNPAGATLATDGGSSAAVPVSSATPTATSAGTAATSATTTTATTRTGATTSAQELLASRLSACKLTVTPGRSLDKRHGILSLTLKAGRACTVTLGANVKNARKRDGFTTRVLRALKTSRKSVTLKANRKKTVQLRFSKRGMGFIKRAVKAKRPLTLTLAVIERDAAKRVSKTTVRTRLKLS